VSDPIFFESPQAFREWLSEHHDSETEVFVGMYKKHTGRQTLSWEDAVDQALCFGWIDGIVRRIDDERHMQRFTPRKATSNWSKANVANVARLEAAGLMQPAGRAAFERRSPERTGIYSFERETPAEFTPEQRRRLDALPEAAAFFDAQQHGYRRLVKHWVTSAKREETRERRFAQFLEDSAAGRRVRQFAPG
jgi:uncharacterized protein YdeI (YjbR/CyaY-like superfamily)